MEQAQILTVSVIVALSLVAGAWWVLRKAYIREVETPRLKPLELKDEMGGLKVFAKLKPWEKKSKEAA